MSFDARILLIAAGCVVCLLFFLLAIGKVFSRRKCDDAKVSLVVSKSDYAVLLVQSDGAIEWVNQGFCRVTGFQANEVTGKALGSILLGALHSPKTTQQLKTGLSGKRTFSLEMLCAHKDGHRYWFSLNLTPVLDEQEILVSFIGLGADITARKRSDDELIRINHRNEMFLNAAGEGIFGLDLQGGITFVNPAAARMTRWDPQELAGKPVSSILHQLRISK